MAAAVLARTASAQALFSSSFACSSDAESRWLGSAALLVRSADCGLPDVGVGSDGPLQPDMMLPQTMPAIIVLHLIRCEDGKASKNPLRNLNGLRMRRTKMRSA